MKSSMFNVHQTKDDLGLVANTNSKNAIILDSELIELLSSSDAAAACAYLPLCFGGCPKNWHAGQGLRCNQAKRLLPKKLKAYLEEIVVNE